jgi:hypothetical protein
MAHCKTQGVQRYAGNATMLLLAQGRDEAPEKAPVHCNATTSPAAPTLARTNSEFAGVRPPRGRWVSIDLNRYDARLKAYSTCIW